ncbi:MAG: GNAT family N-acetyltransferase [Proteobacteria bacterium]|nr:GNAT family N-acetyltransferase [Pseudomonadota bacterium]
MLKTERLILRNWKEEDLEPFAALNACEYVCEFLPKILSKEESNSLAKKIITHFEQHGFGLFAVERKDTGEFIGFAGLSIPGFDAHFTPATEIGWRLAYEHWGFGFATEAAIVVRDSAFDELDLKELVSFTTKNNKASRRVMEKIGMTHDEADDFDHPNLKDGHPLKPHVLYRESRK